MRQLIAILLFAFAAYLFINEWHLWPRLDDIYHAGGIVLAIDIPQLRFFCGLMVGMAGLILYQGGND